jgi:hypothetical protein
VTITLPPPIAHVVLSGQVKDANGQGVAEVLVHLSGASGSRSGGSHTTDASGRYRFEVPPGQYRLMVDSMGRRRYTLHAEGALTVTQDTTMDIVLPFKRVVVHVQDVHGNPVGQVGIETDRVRVELPLGSVTGEGFSEYSRRDVATDAAGDAVLWLFPTSTGEGYTLTVTPPAGTPFAVFQVPNIMVRADRSEIIVLQYDHAPPVTTATVTSAPNGGPVTVSLAATATGGYTLAATYYTIDKGPRQTYTGPFTVSGEGKHSVTYWSVDNSDVMETAKLMPIEISTRP